MGSTTSLARVVMMAQDRMGAPSGGRHDSQTAGEGEGLTRPQHDSERLPPAAYLAPLVVSVRHHQAPPLAEGGAE